MESAVQLAVLHGTAAGRFYYNHDIFKVSVGERVFRAIPIEKKGHVIHSAEERTFLFYS